MNDNLWLLRYNTGTDKQVFVKFKSEVSAVIFNATIVAYSSSAVADLVSVHKNQYIIDPQTHIFQHKIDSIQNSNKNGEKVIKKSVLQYFAELPDQITEAFFANNGELTPKMIYPYLYDLVASVYSFETGYVDKYTKKKEYDKYLEFVKLGPSPRVVIAPYFMLKSSYDDSTIESWMELNRYAAEQFIQKNNKHYQVGLQLVLDRDVLERESLIEKVVQAYSGLNAEYIFLWIDRYIGFDANKTQRLHFKRLLETLTKLGLKPIMAYGGFDSILLCSSDLPYRMYGVAHSVGYGEYREITPVGGGLPVNKFYFPPLHSRLNISDVIRILSNEGFFSIDEKEAARRFYSEICSCKQCQSVIKGNINNFYEYNDSTAFTIKGNITRNRPTTDANLISAIHFMYAKLMEWELVEKYSFKQLSELLIRSFSQYDSNNLIKISEWCALYEE